jgi:hypothetical protein
MGETDMKTMIAGLIIMISLVYGATYAVAGGESVTNTEGETYTVPEDRQLITIPLGMDSRALIWIRAGFSEQMDYEPLVCDGLVFGPTIKDPRCPVGEPEVCDNYDFYDDNHDGVVDYGPQQGCEYDPCVGASTCS